jgi:murein DD-endopeptidase MepM/ murein hydrolase activator NlpD
VVLADGTAVALGPKPARDDLAPGIVAKFKGYRFDDGSVVASEPAATFDSFSPDSKLSPYTCLELRVVPFQDYLFKKTSQMTVLPLDGYRQLSGPKYMLEDRMWLTAETKPGSSCGGGDDIFSFKRRTFRLVIKQQGSEKIMAEDLAPGELAAFPSGIDPASDATLEVTARRQNCSVAFGCSDTFEEISGTDSLKVRVLSTGAYCVAEYEAEEFQLEDVDFVIGQSTSFPQFRPAKVTGIASLVLAADPDTVPVFTAGAYRISNGTSSYPSAELIGENTEFAIYQNHDFYWNYDLYAFESTGVKGPAGLEWPRVVALRHGNFIQYHCNTPLGLVRDVVDFCSVGPNSYYRLPFSGGFPTWTMGQGNNGTFTHKGKQAYAFDFGANAGTTVRAARGGKVLFVRESVPSNSNCYLPFTEPSCQAANNFVSDNGCTANAVTIRHQDGTVGEYFHMPMNGVSVAKGAKLRRGDVIAEVGNTGCSSNAHLHFHSVVAADEDQTTQIRFQTALESCDIPQTGDFLFSNNP